MLQLCLSHPAPQPEPISCCSFWARGMRKGLAVLLLGPKWGLGQSCLCPARVGCDSSGAALSQLLLCPGATSKTFQHKARLGLLCPTGLGRSGSQIVLFLCSKPIFSSSPAATAPFPLPPPSLGCVTQSGFLCLGHPVLLLHLSWCPCASGTRGHQQRAVASVR